MTQLCVSLAIEPYHKVLKGTEEQWPQPGMFEVIYGALLINSLKRCKSLQQADKRALPLGWARQCNWPWWCERELDRGPEERTGPATCDRLLQALMDGLVEAVLESMPGVCVCV